MAELGCWNCGASLAALPRPITRHMNCPICFEDLHCCRLCQHYRAKATDSCADERAEPPVHKEGANFCDFFRPKPDACQPGSNVRQARAKTNLDALFSDRGTEPTAEPAEPNDEQGEARRKLEDIFR